MNDPQTLAITAAIFLLIGFFIGFAITMKLLVPWYRHSRKMQRSILGGKFSEQLAPYLRNFPTDLKASEARFLGDPIDFVFFRGKDERNITEIVFLEVKSGRSQLNDVENQIREVIAQKKIRWHEYRVPEEVSRIN